MHTLLLPNLFKHCNEVVQYGKLVEHYDNIFDDISIY